MLSGAANIVLDILAQMQPKFNDNRDSCERMALLIVGKPQTGRQTPNTVLSQYTIVSSRRPQLAHLSHAILIVLK